MWRADRPQKGRYREFYQCDADVVGSDSLVNEIELLQIEDTVFSRLGIRVAIKLNNRKILAGIAELIGGSDKLIDITVAIDKIDKIGLEKVNEELAARGLSVSAIEALRPILALDGTGAERIDKLAALLTGSEVGSKGVEELRTVYEGSLALGLNAALDIDVSLARGLNYYTAPLSRVKALDTEMGSISGGGRYDKPHGSVRPRRNIGCGHLFRCRPHLRCASGAQPLPRRHHSRHTSALRQLRCCRGYGVDEACKELRLKGRVG